MILISLLMAAATVKPQGTEPQVPAPRAQLMVMATARIISGTALRLDAAQMPISATIVTRNTTTKLIEFQ
jgi:hypothetical protein